MRKLRGEAYAFSAGRKSKLLDYPKYHGLNFFKNCSFPESLRCLGLCFSKIDWEMFIDDPSSLVAFDSQPENLQNLEILTLSIPDVPQWKGKEQVLQYRLAIEIFLKDLLKKIPICKELNLTLS